MPTPHLLHPMTVDDVPAVLAVEEPGAVLALAGVFPQDTHPFPPDEVGRRWLAELADEVHDEVLDLLRERGTQRARLRVLTL